jgi:probable HAF family extracellular repeat protein
MSKLTFAALLLLATAPLALAQGTYTQIDYPGARETYAWGVGSQGDIVGSYVDTQYTVHGFLLSGGTYATIDFPGAALSTVTGVNASGQMVGFYEPSANSAFIGFFLDNTGFTSVDYPGSSQTEILGINDGGVAVGNYGNANGFSAGFKWSAGAFSHIRAPRGSTSEGAFGINNLGDIVVSVSRATGGASYLLTKGMFLRITFPGAQNLTAYTVNDSREVVGIYENANFALLGFVVKGRRSATSLSFPNSIYTIATGINNSGEVVGYFRDTSGNYHTFTWTPPADAGKK